MQPLTIRCSNRRQWHGRRGRPATVAPPPFSIATTSGHGGYREDGGGEDRPPVDHRPKNTKYVTKYVQPTDAN